MTSEITASTAAPVAPAGPVMASGQAMVPITGAELGIIKQGATDPAAVRTALMMRDALTPEMQAKAHAEAAKAYADMKTNPQVIISFGSPATQEYDAVGSRLLKQVGGKNIDVIQHLLEQLNDGMRNIDRKYNVKTNPDARKRYDQWGGRFKRWFHLGKDFFEMMLEDLKKFDSQLDDTADKLGEQQAIEQRNLGFYNELYEANKEALDLLVYYIAQMEYVAEMAAADAESIVVDQAQPGWERKREERDRLADIANTIQVKAGDYKGIYMIAVATAPQIRMESNQILGITAKLETVRVQIIGVMKRTLAQWIMLIQSGDAAAMAAFVAETNNQWIQEYMQTAPELITSIAEGVQTPTLSADTIAIMAQSIEDQATAIVTAMQKGYADRLAVDDAIRAALPQINAAGAKVSDETIKMVLGSVVKAAEQSENPAAA